jgi:hypothetical protein
MCKVKMDKIVEGMKIIQLKVLSQQSPGRTGENHSKSVSGWSLPRSRFEVGIS